MPGRNFESVFADWEQRAGALSRVLHPIVHAKVDINSDSWLEDLKNAPHPADKAGQRPEIEALFREIIDRFESCNAAQRQQLVELMEQNDALMYSAVIDSSPDTENGFRDRMLLVVLGVATSWSRPAQSWVSG